MKKKLLFVNGHLNTGGVEKSLVDVLRHLDYDRYDVDLLLLETLGDYVDQLPPEVHVCLKSLQNTYGSLVDCILRCFRENDWFCLKMRLIFLIMKLFGQKWITLSRKMLTGRTHYDYAIGFRPGICTQIAAFVADADRHITWWHHGEYNLDAHAAKNYRLACSRMDYVVSVSESCASFLREKHPEIAGKLTVIPNLLDAETIIQKSALFNPYQDDGVKCHLVSVGRLSPEKHIENVIFAAASLSREGYKDFKWYIVGDGSERQKLEQLAVEHGVQAHVIFVGSQPNPYSYMKYADLFVHPSYVESQGLVVLEAMTLGVPCVVTRSLGPCEFIEDGINGILTEQSAESLAEKVNGILRDVHGRNKLRDNTRSPEQFMPYNVVEKINNLWR